MVDWVWWWCIVLLVSVRNCLIIWIRIGILVLLVGCVMNVVVVICVSW